MSAVTPGELRARNLRTLAALAALFLMPLVLAFFVYYGTNWRPAAHVNHGQLITPARPLPDAALPRVGLAVAPVASGTAATSAPAPLFRNRWSLVYLGGGDCDAACREALYVMRQTRIALNKDMTRVERVFLVISACCDRPYLAREHPGLEVLDATVPGAQPLIAQFPGEGREHTLFVVDPLGNLVMSYDAREDPRGLLQDLQRLLRLSHIG
jgi:hypothetical protein